jgi:hypothetical protein
MITILFSTTKKWTLVSWIIKSFTHSKVSHSAIGTDMHGIPVILGADAHGVAVTPRSTFEKTDKVVWEFEIIAPITEEDLQRVIGELGEKYDYGSILGFALLLKARDWFKVKIKNIFASSGMVVCSEYCTHLNARKVIPEWNNLDPEATDAEDLLRICKNGGSFTRIIDGDKQE